MIFFIFYIVNKYFIEFFSNNYIHFMTKEETINFILNDKDNYVKNMSYHDLYARKVSSSDDYINLIINSCLDFTEDQKRIIRKNSNGASFKISLIDEIYEEGFPHTREDIIFISPNIINLNLKRIIKHELVHIKQRYRKNKQYKHYIISRNRNTEPLIRANPDLDEFIYKDSINGLEFYYIYSSDKPNGINDIIKINNLGEHPNEIEAYEMENK